MGSQGGSSLPLGSHIGQHFCFSLLTGLSHYVSVLMGFWELPPPPGRCPVGRGQEGYMLGLKFPFPTGSQQVALFEEVLEL